MKFSPKNRLLKKSDFEVVFSSVRHKEQGRILRNRHFVIYQRYTDQTTRLGLSISKKAIRLAVKRNRVKRCLREYFRNHQSQMTGDIIVRWTKAPKDYHFQTIVQPLLRLEEMREPQR